MPLNAAQGQIRHIFVLMLENRSFDHMLGLSGITGIDAATGQPTTIAGLTGTEFNAYNGVRYPTTSPADWAMPIDPDHEFLDVLEQLCGPAATYPPGGIYPPASCSGFAWNYARASGQNNPGEIMKCYRPEQLPVLVTLAKEFALFDHWFSSMPGPTWPNRFFLHAASSGGLDHSPTTLEVIGWELFAGFTFSNGTIFDALTTFDRAHGWRIYAGGEFPNVAAIKGINNFEVRAFDDFADDLDSDYQVRYTFIEPNYGDVAFNTYRGGNSQHPLDDVRNGERLIKSVYESIRNSSIWNNSLLIVTWDEHGGFFDHLPPPGNAIPPGDTIVTHGANKYGFNFTQYGPRVPAIAISPLIPKNIIDHRIYDHASVPATIEALFGLSALTQRDAAANNLTPLITLATPRTDTPTKLPAPGQSIPDLPLNLAATAPAPPPANALESADKGNLPGFLHSALASDLALSPPSEHPVIYARFKAIKTRSDAQHYLTDVRTKVHAGRLASKTIKDRRAKDGLV